MIDTGKINKREFMKQTHYINIVFIILCTINVNPLCAQNSPQKEQLINTLRALTEHVKQGKSLDDALIVAENLLSETDPEIQKHLQKLNSAIARWCIVIIEQVKK